MGAPMPVRFRLALPLGDWWVRYAEAGNFARGNRSLILHNTFVKIYIALLLCPRCWCLILVHFLANFNR